MAARKKPVKKGGAYRTNVERAGWTWSHPDAHWPMRSRGHIPHFIRNFGQFPLKSGISDPFIRLPIEEFLRQSFLRLPGQKTTSRLSSFSLGVRDRSKLL